MNAPNPYWFVGQAVVGEDFVERPELTRRITDMWRGPGRPANLSLFGHHRVGKTSLVDRALSLADRDDLGIVRLSMGRQASVFDLFRTLTREVAACFPQVTELAELARPVHDTRDWFDLHGGIAEFFKELGRSGLYVLVALDDFDRAPRVLAELSPFQLLRTLASEAAYPVGLLTVSRRPIIEIETDAAGGSRLDGVMTDRAYVGMFTAAEAGRLVDRARRAGVDLSAVLPEITARSGLHPYLLGLLCHRAVEQYHTTGVLDMAAAAAEEAPAFRAHFGRLVDSVQLDTAGQGLTLLRHIAARRPAPADSQDLQQLADMGVVVRNGKDLRLFSAEFASYTLTPPGTADDRSAPDAYRCTVLVVATEWNSAHGGLSSFNQQLCAALAAQGARVFCMVPEATESETGRAKARGVTLLHRPLVAGAPELSRLIRRPELPEGVVPDVVIGHGRITGPAALMLSEDHFPDARKLHFVHMDPDEIEWHKLDREDDAVESAESRKRIELALARDADRLVAVGPRLHGQFLGALSRREDRTPLRFDPGFDMTDARPRRVPGGTPRTVLIMGRLEDATLKGVDLAARACGLVAGWRHQENLPRIQLVVRGVPKEGSAQQTERLKAWAGNPRLTIVPRHYTTDAETLSDDIDRASLLLMPSRGEGFGLVGLEAVVAGTPVLISEASGLGELLNERLSREQAAQWVVPMSGDLDLDTMAWARQIDRVLRGIETEFPKAQRMRKELAAALTWSASADGLLKAVGF
ncbi:glycosyltransferase [Streptomyces sp.]|uniref:glycosyltransferase n=1 Tax=Streptomyces sp. TaxID=1931 RepID=UPI002F3E6788